MSAYHTKSRRQHNKEKMTLRTLSARTSLFLFFTTLFCLLNCSGKSPEAGQPLLIVYSFSATFCGGLNQASRFAHQQLPGSFMELSTIMKQCMSLQATFCGLVHSGCQV